MITSAELRAQADALETVERYEAEARKAKEQYRSRRTAVNKESHRLASQRLARARSGMTDVPGSVDEDLLDGLDYEDDENEGGDE